MDEDAKKTALRMIPYGLCVVTTTSKDGNDIGAVTVNCVTQASFNPPLIAAGIKADSGAHAHIKDTGVFAVNVLGKD
jgi:flavin reductase (DIM6/NTAB) family NADH-FMN oxidoreductase RutF